MKMELTKDQFDSLVNKCVSAGGAPKYVHVTATVVYMGDRKLGKGWKTVNAFRSKLK